MRACIVSPLSLLALSLLSTSGAAQEIFGTHETVDFDSPEGWAMAYMTAAALNTGQLPPRETTLGAFSLAAEIGSIPGLNDDQQRVGFGGFKDEDLNKSPVFGRARLSLGLPWNVSAELSWTPPLEVDGAKPDDLWGIAFSRPIITAVNWGLGARVYALEGQVRADVTCSAEVAAQPPGSPGNQLSCLGPSDDHLEMDHLGAELVFSLPETQSGLQPWLSYAVTRMDPHTEVNALVLGAIDHSTIDTEGTAHTVSAGVSYHLRDHWRMNLTTAYTPLDAARPPSNPGGQDNFWQLKLGLAWEL